MNSNKAMELGFVDGVITREQQETPEDGAAPDEGSNVVDSVLFSRRAVNNVLLNKLERHYKKPTASAAAQANIPIETGTPAAQLKERLNFIKG